MGMYGLDNVIIDPTGLEFCDNLQVIGINSCGQVILGKPQTAEQLALCGTELTVSNSCIENGGCPLMQPIITNILNLPGLPAPCPGGILGWSEGVNPQLMSICPNAFDTFFNFQDKHVAADVNDIVPGTLISKMFSCDPTVLNISLDTAGGNHRVKFCLNLANADLKLINLSDGPGTYPVCTGPSTGILYSAGTNWNWLCVGQIGTIPCVSDQSVLTQEKHLVFDYVTNTLKFKRAKPFYHASVWYTGGNIIYTGNPLTNDLELTSIPCMGRGDDLSDADHYLSCMYTSGTTAVGGYNTYDIVIPEEGYWMLNFRAACQCNKYTHAFRMGVAQVDLADPESTWKIIAHIKKGAMEDEYEPPADGDVTFIWEELFACSSDPKTILTNLKESEMSGGFTEEYWFAEGTRLRMFIKADGNTHCAGVHPPAKIRLVGFNEYTNNHPKAVVAGFSVWKIPKEIAY